MNLSLRSFYLYLILAVCSYGQTSPFPGAASTDANLGVARNNVKTTLSSALSAGGTSFTVTSSTRMVANMMLSIGTTSPEIVWVCSVVGTTVSVGRVSCPNVDGRGFDSTTAAAHVSGERVENGPVSWYTNAGNTELKAVETYLVGGAAGTVSAVSYNFATQTPGGSLIVGNTSVTLTPVPLGVNGTDTHHYLYVSGGSGTAEACLITGGAGTSGQTTGAIILNCAFTHSGAWTVKSATYGASEACQANSPCNLSYPAGTYDWYGTFWSAGNVTITGGGAGVTTLRWNQLTAKMFDIERDRFILRGMKLQQVGTAAAGNAGVYMAGASSTVAAAAFEYGELSDLLLTGFYNGIKYAGDGGSIDLYRVHVFNSVSDQIVAAGAQGYWSRVLVINGGANGINLSNCPSAPCGYSPFMAGIQTYGNNGWGITSTIFVQVSGLPSFFNNDKSGEIYVNLSAGTSAENGFISDSYIQYAGVAPAGAAWSTNTSAPGILLDTGSGPISITNNHFLGTQGNCINLKASLVNVTNNRILSCGAGAQAGNIYGILVDATHGFEVIEGNHISVPNRIDGLYNTIRGNVFYPNSASPGLYISVGTDIVFDGNQFQQAGAGTAYTIDAAVTLMDGYNVVTSGTVTYNGQRSSTTKQLNPFPPHSIGANVASAGTITPTGELFHITGVAAIATINLPGGYAGPRICAIPDGIFTTTTAGNIALASTAVVNKVLCWMYETTSAKWFPSY